jgi:mannose-6-phosphate isomerase-like protein (cupin superfamily)
MIRKETAEHYTWGGGCDGWHLVRQPEVSVIQERMPPGSAEVRHAHARARQFFFILAGTATMEIGEGREVLRAQEGIEIAPGVYHRISNEGIGDLEFLVISQPPSHGDRIVSP